MKKIIVRTEKKTYLVGFSNSLDEFVNGPYDGYLRSETIKRRSSEGSQNPDDYDTIVAYHRPLQQTVTVEAQPIINNEKELYLKL